MQQEQLRRLVEQLVTGTLSPHDFMQTTSEALTGSSDTLTGSSDTLRGSVAQIHPGDSQPLQGGDSVEAVSLDLDREHRCGFPEVIYGAGKMAETIADIARRLLENGQRVLATRIEPSQADVVTQRIPQARYNRLARTVRIDPEQTGKQTHDDQRAHDDRRGQVAVLSAGTSDRPVAEEAVETLDWMGVRATMIHDVGVAGPHRLPQRLAEFASSDAIVVVAGMEGALPSIVGGYVACPVFAVPTSVGYGASLGGIAALLSMLNSCASNVAVVNIDAGFKAGYLAGLVATRCCAADVDSAQRK
ncbi:MAG: nickel pincer cofactor biosynthesis protein LarB [Pirellulales bacterium]